MPYKATNELPESVRDHLPAHAQRIFMDAFNKAWDEYSAPGKRRGDESQEEAAFRVAWTAVKQEYRKDEATGDWEPKH